MLGGIAVSLVSDRTDKWDSVVVCIYLTVHVMSHESVGREISVHMSQ